MLERQTDWGKVSSCLSLDLALEESTVVNLRSQCRIPPNDVMMIDATVMAAVRGACNMCVCRYGCARAELQLQFRVLRAVPPWPSAHPTCVCLLLV